MERTGGDNGIQIETDPVTGKQVSAVINLDLLGSIFNEFYGEPKAGNVSGNAANLFAFEAAKLLEAAQKFLGTPYVYGESSTNGCDCSGFVKLAFSEIGINLPHQSGSQGELGAPVSVNNLQKGDLLFFNTDSHKGTHVNHVGIVLEAGNSGVKMIHASSGRKKVLIDNNIFSKNNYWEKAFLFAKRLKA
jgi:cell wall-associated NlpC family hydrolase